MDSLVGVDVGGTFTDLYFRSDTAEAPLVLKVPSTPEDPSLGLLHALEAARIDPDRLNGLLHGTTIATNAVIERTGATCALLTTAGFRDVLELGRRDRPQMYGLSGEQHPLIPRDRRYEVPERVDHRGTVLVPLDEDGVRAVAADLRGRGIESVVVSFLHSYANPAHEHRACALLAEADPSWHVVAASDVLREWYEFERTSTAVVQGYLQPLVSAYASGLQDKLDKWDYRRDVLVMQSNGGVVTVDRMAQRAANFIRSGPAAGVIAAARLADEAGFPDVITADMGGTSFDVAVVRNGAATVADTTYLDFRVPLRLPMLDVHTIGAGGGSIATIDRGGVLQVGPRSAGSYPGPICFRHGGTEPTVTDANLVLGRIDAGHPIGALNDEALDLDGARAAYERLGAELGLSCEDAAAAVLSVVNQRMAGRIRLLSVEQGQDPRNYAMVAFGGAGPLHGAALVRDVGIRAMLVPPTPGVLCALGCAIADVQYDYGQTLHRPVDDVDERELRAVMERHTEEGRRQLANDGVALEDVVFSHVADMAYQAQIHSLRVPIERGWTMAQMAEAFQRLYRDEYGTPLGEMGVVIETLRTTVVGRRPVPKRAPLPTPPSGPPAPRSRRQVHFGTWYDTPIYRRDDLRPGTVFDGPAVVEQADTTTVVEPGLRVTVDGFTNLIVEVP